MFHSNPNSTDTLVNMPKRTRSSPALPSTSGATSSEATKAAGVREVKSSSQRRERGTLSRKPTGKSDNESGEMVKTRKLSVCKRTNNARKKESSYEFTGFEALTEENAAAARAPHRTRPKRSIASITAASPVVLSDSPKRRRTSPLTTNDHRPTNESSTLHSSATSHSASIQPTSSHCCQPTSKAATHSDANSKHSIRKTKDLPPVKSLRRSCRLQSSSSSRHNSSRLPRQLKSHVEASKPQFVQKRLDTKRSTVALTEKGELRNSVGVNNVNAGGKSDGGTSTKMPIAAKKAAKNDVMSCTRKGGIDSNPPPSNIIQHNSADVTDSDNIRFCDITGNEPSNNKSSFRQNDITHNPASKTIEQVRISQSVDMTLGNKTDVPAQIKNAVQGQNSTDRTPSTAPGSERLPDSPRCTPISSDEKFLRHPQTSESTVRAVNPKLPIVLSTPAPCVSNDHLDSILVSSDMSKSIILPNEGIGAPVNAAPELSGKEPEESSLSQSQSVVRCEAGKGAKCNPGDYVWDVDANEALVEADKTAKCPSLDQFPREEQLVTSRPGASGENTGTAQQLPLTSSNGSTSDIRPIVRLPPANGSIMKKRASVLSESVSKLPQEGGVQKRVRFQEPSQPLRTSGKNLRLMQLVRRRQERSLRRTSPGSKSSTDICVTSAKTSGSNTEIDQVLLDDLQYLLDGVFQYDASNKKDCKLVLSSLQSLIPLLRKGCHGTGSKDLSSHESVIANGGASTIDMDDCLSDVMEMLVAQPHLLSKIVTHLFKLLGNGPLIDAYVGLVLIIIFQSAGPMILISELEWKILISTYVQSCKSSIRNNVRSCREKKQPGQKTDDSAAEKSSGKPTATTNDSEDDRTSNGVLNRLMREAGVVAFDSPNAEIWTFDRSTDAATYIVGTVLAVLLSKVPRVRGWVREVKYLGHLIAVLYALSSQSVMKEHLTQGGAENASNLGTSWKIVVGGVFKVLECASLDSICQSRIVSQTKVFAVALRVVQWFRIGKSDGLDSEWVVCNALKASINLTRGCSGGATRFAECNGIGTVLDCLVRECMAAGLIGVDKNSNEQVSGAISPTTHAAPVEGRSCEESFDIRVLCLVLLANVVAGEQSIKESLSEIKIESVPNMSGGALGIPVEILKHCTAKQDVEVSNKLGFEPNDGNTFDAIDEGTSEADRGIEKISDRANVEMTESNLFGSQKKNPSDVGDDVKTSSREMESKVTIGYLCLLIGVFAWRCDKNRAILEAMLPHNGLQRLAGVLQECQEFHQEVGINCASLDGVYAQIIHALRNHRPVYDVDAVPGASTDIITITDHDDTENASNEKLSTDNLDTESDGDKVEETPPGTSTT